MTASVAVVIYVLIDVLLAFLRPDLSLLHRAESDYGVGPYSWLMDINFLLRGVLSLALAAALLRLGAKTGRLRVGVGFLAAWGIGSALLAFFPDDPPGTPPTTAGAIHLDLALVAFLCAVVGTIALSLGLRHFPELRQLGGFLLALAVVAIIPLALLGHTHFRPQSLGGLYERIFLGLELLWILIVGIACQRATIDDPRQATESP
ncbi:MAG TPA: DUF998 domain-containing protein [Candidatus Dormibacteraeota bacterium]|nr:DUF998 domain-containing protein [Candidatus Dormibacteraeota bacterium]